MKASRVSMAIANGVFIYSNAAIAANSTSSLKSETATIAKNLMAITNNGLLPAPYSWWETGALFGAMINYALYTGDSTYSSSVASGMVAQVGTNNDFMPSSQSSSEGNDDQSFWAMAAMSAAETGFQNPSDSAGVGWLGFAENVFNEQANRWDNSTCNGGLPEGTSSSQSTFTSKTALSNGGLFNLAARLARYTSNSTFADMATTVWDWSQGVGLVNGSGAVFTSTSDSSSNCSTIVSTQFTADSALYLLGAAHMYNSTSSSVWKTRVQEILNTVLGTFFPDGDGIMIEVACERQVNCTTDQLAYKSILVSALTDTAIVAPFISATILPNIQSSANAAVKSCTGPNGDCGTQWTWGEYDKLTGAGQDMAALQVMQGLLVNSTAGFKNAATGASATSSSGSSSTSGSSSPTTSKKSSAQRLVLGSSLMLGVVAIFVTGCL